MRLTAGEINILIKARDEASRAMGRIGNAAGSMGKAIKRGAQIAGLALAALGIAAAATFINFDSAMTKSIAIMGDLDDAMRETMEVTARDVAKTTTFSMTEAADSYFFLASAGLSAEQSIAALPQVAQFAQAGMFDMALATDLLTDAQSALGLTVDDTAQNLENMTRVSDVLVKANTLANATVEQFSTALTRDAGAALKSFKIDVEEGVAVLAAFADQGVKGELAGTGLARILRIMTSAAVNNAEAYEQLGIAVFDSTGNINNLADIIGELEDALIPMSDETRVAALEALGFSARIQGVILPLLGTSEAIREYDSALRDAAGTTAEIAEKQLESLGAQLSLLRSGFEDVLFTVGKEMEPALRKLVATLREDVIPAIESGLPGALDNVTNAVKDAIPVIQQIGDDIETAFTFIIENEAAIVAAIAAIGAVIVLALGPVSAAALALAGIALAIELFRTDIEDLSPAMVELERKILEQTVAWGQWVTVGGVAAGVLIAFTGNIPAALAAIAVGAGAAIAVSEAANRLDELGPVFQRNRAIINAHENTFLGLKKALDETDGSMVTILSTSGKLAFQLPRTTVEAKLLAFAIQEVADEGPNAAAALEVMASVAIASGQAFHTMTIEMLQTTAVMQAMAEQWTSTQASFVGFGTSPDIQAAIDKLAEFNAAALGGGDGRPPPVAQVPDLGPAMTAEVEETIQELMPIWLKGALQWMDAVQEALDNEAVWGIIASTIESRVVRLQDVLRLLDLGEFGQEVAQDFINALEGESSKIGAAIFAATEEEARAAAEEAAVAFREAFEAELEGLGEAIAGQLSVIQEIAGGESRESALIALRIAQRRLEILGLEEEAMAAQQERLEAIAELEGRIAEERRAAQIILDGINDRIERELEGLAEAERRLAETREQAAIDMAVAEEHLQTVRETGTERIRDMERELSNLRNQLDRSAAIAGGERTLTDIAEQLEQARGAGNIARARGFAAELAAATAIAEARVSELEEEISAEEALIQAAQDAVDAILDTVTAIEEEIAERKALIDALEAGIEVIEAIRDANIERYEAEIEAIENTTSAAEDRIAELEEEIRAFQDMAAVLQLTRDIEVLRAQLLMGNLPSERALLANLEDQVILWAELNRIFDDMRDGIFSVTDAAVLMQAGLFELARMILEINAGLLPAPGSAGFGAPQLGPGAPAAVFTGGGGVVPVAVGGGTTIINNHIRQILVTGDLEETLKGLS